MADTKGGRQAAASAGAEGMLAPYRVLDLTDEKGLLCGKLLGDLGADVIKIERPGGDPARSIDPFRHDDADPEKSLFWWAFNTSKRGITLDLETTEGQGAFRSLVADADIVLESFPPGTMEELSLGYSALSETNPGIILVSITPFGQTGPYSHYKAPDIVAWAMGGQMYSCGDADRPPLRMSHHSQAYLHAGAEAAVAALMALHHRHSTGEGQHADVSIQSCLAQATQHLTGTWDMVKVLKRRGQSIFPNVKVRIPRIWPCKDGYVYYPWWRGLSAAWNDSFLQWMDDEGRGDKFLRSFDWGGDWLTTTAEEADRIEQATRKFFLAYTRAEIMGASVQRRLQLYPVYSTVEIADDAQLTARRFWQTIRHPELAESILYPGAFAQASAAPARVSRCAPMVGEHNEEILGKAPSVLVADHTAARRAMDMGSMSTRPLEGVRVVDFTWALVGPVTTKALSDWGAEVIKIESRSRPCSIRVSGPFKDGVPGLERSGDFAQYNTGKLSVALNLAYPTGIDIAKRLVAGADIVVENFAGGVMERMGLGYDALKEIKPDIIMLSSCMQGQTGPHALSRGNGYLLTALAGFIEITGWPDRAPVAPEGPFIDFVAPRFNALAILAALEYRRRTGKGQYLDVSQFENGMHFLAPLILDYLVNGRVATRQGNRCDRAAPHGAYRCRGDDRWCAIAAFTDQEWRDFCGAIGDPPWTRDSRFGTLLSRKLNEDELDRLVETWTIDRSAEAVMHRLQAAGAPAGVLENGQDLLEQDPQLQYRGAFQELDHPEIGSHHVPSPHYILSKAVPRIQRAPLIGEHNEYVLKTILGVSDEEIAELVIEGALE